MYALALVFLVELLSTASSLIVSSVDTLRTSYDFVIIGGGTAGLVLANRLSEDFTVLVLEAGGSHSEDLDITVPFFGRRATPGTMYDWNYTTVPQAGMNGRQTVISRGYLLGGSSSINFMVYTRGSRDDYDRYADITGDQGWSWSSLLPYWLKAEKLGPSADLHDTTGQVDPSVHGFEGMVPSSLPGFHLPFDDIVLKATDELKDDFPFTQDFNGGNQIGVGYALATISNGERSSSATSYLFANEVFVRGYLDVLIGARVTRVLQTGGSASQTPKFSEVEFTVNGESRKITASKEIILSAGTLNTPHILMHSGIGDRDELASLGIQSTVAISSVGKNLSDHVGFSLFWLVNSTATLEQWTRNATRMDEAFEEWKVNRTGVLVTNSINHLGFFRSNTLSAEEDPSAGYNTGHYEFLFSSGSALPELPEGGSYMSISIVLVSPSSRGNLTLRSSDPLDGPLINPQYLSSEVDRRIMREAFRSALQFVSAPVFKDYIISPLFDVEEDDVAIDAFIQGNAYSVCHPVSTAAMSKPGLQSDGVVDPNLKVKGVEGLRIVDASVLPRIPAAHTMAAVYAVAERAADLIKDSW